MIEKSYVMVKPGFANHIEVINEIKKCILALGLKIIKGEYVSYSPNLAKKHYAEHVGKDFYPKLEKYITSDVAYGMIVEGENAIAKIRRVVGSTNNPATGTIRREMPKLIGREVDTTENVVHASDSTESAEREIAIFEKMIMQNENC